MTDGTRTHPDTGETLRRAVRTKTIAYAIYAKAVAVPGWYPDGDGDAIHTGADLAEWNAAFVQMRSDYAKRIRGVRKRLGFTQAEAGRVLGGGKRAFQKYEAGKTPPSDAAIALIELIDRHPEEVELLRKLPGRALEAA